jgi:hypothetical protein
MSVGRTNIFVFLTVAIGYAPQLFAGTLGVPFEKVIWPDDPHQNEAYCDISVVLLRSLERWNAHDIDGFLEASGWKSDGVVTTLNGSTIHGWRQISAAYHQGYADLNTMGSVEYDSLGTDLLTPDLALVLLGWTQTIDSKKRIAELLCGERPLPLPTANLNCERRTADLSRRLSHRNVNASLPEMKEGLHKRDPLGESGHKKYDPHAPIRCGQTGDLR